MELIDTIDGMTSADYKERLKAEYQQAKIRLDKLINFIESYDEDRRIDTPIELYVKQYEAMKDYILILKIRAKIEGINLY